MSLNRGLHISQLPFGRLSFVGILLSKYFPSTILYKDSNDDPIIIEWMSLDSDKNDIYIAYKSSLANLKKYTEKKINHLELILNCEDGIIFEFLNTIEGNETFIIKSADNLSKKSLPKQDSFFDSTLSEDIELIKNSFNLDSIILEDDDMLEELSTQFESDIIRLHFENHENVVEHGLIDSAVLGEVLLSFNNLYSEVAKDRFLGAERRHNRRAINYKALFEESKRTQVVVGNEAASFAIYIKPKTSSISIGDDVILNCSDIIADINQLFSLSKNSVSFETIINNYNKAVFRELSIFSEKTFEYGLNFDLKYFNQSSQLKSYEKLTKLESEIINRNILSKIDIQNETLTLKGKFCSLNTDTGYYTFLVDHGRKIRGHFSGSLFDTLRSFNFQNSYTIVVQKSIKYNLNKLRNSYSFTINSFEEN